MWRSVIKRWPFEPRTGSIYKSRRTHQIIPCNCMDVKQQISSTNDCYIFLYVGCFCFWICLGITENKTDCRRSGFNVCTYHHLLLRWENSWFNQEKNIWRFFVYWFPFVCFLFLLSLFASPTRPRWLVFATECIFSYSPALTKIMFCEPNWSRLVMCRHPQPHRVFTTA